MNRLIQTCKKCFKGLLSSFYIMTSSLFAASGSDPWADAKILPEETKDFSIMGKGAFTLGNTILFILLVSVSLVFVRAIINVAQVFNKATKEDDYSTFIKDVGISLAVIVIVLVLASLAYVFGIEKIRALAK